MKPLTAASWHNRFLQQAGWTAQLCSFILKQLELVNSTSVVEVGSGTGVVLSELALPKSILQINLDLKDDFLRFSSSIHPNQSHLQANGLYLPFESGSVSASLTHFLLLWINHPSMLLDEMIRITRSGGVVVALAEPDYGGRIDHPAELLRLGQMQADSLFKQGADPFIGRKLSSLFHQAGLINVQSGILGGHWGEPPSTDAWDSEWTTLEQDLEGIIPADEMHTLRQLDAAAWQKGERILFVPTFYAWGYVP
jgi:SAM-dependent methyltransferase